MFLYSIFGSIDLNSYDDEATNRFIFHVKNSQTNTSAPSNLIEPFIVDNKTFVHEEERSTKALQLDGKEIDINSLEHDPEKHPPI